MNIDNYLSEEQKERIAIEEWRKLVRSKMVDQFEGNMTKAVQNYERVISNAVHRYLSKEIDSVLDQDHEELIKKKVTNTLKKKDISFELFRKSSAWDRERSPAQTVIFSCVKSKRGLIDEKVREAIENISPGQMESLLKEILPTIIKEKLS